MLNILNLNDMNTLFNKFMMVIVAVVMVIGFSAFKIAQYQAEISGEWHFYTPSITPDPYDPNQYQSGGSEHPDCMDGFELCAVWTPEDEPLTREYLEELDLNSGIGNSQVIFKD
jgi:hypothetical protein